MVHVSPFEMLALVGLSMSLPLFGVSVYQYRGSPFGDVLALLAGAAALGVATVLVGVLPVGGDASRVATLALVGTGALLSAAGAVRLVQMTSGRCSL